MSLAIFDLDNTLIAGDSDHAWGQFLIEQGRVDADAYKQANDQFYQDYCAGTLDIQAYLRFALAPLKKLDRDELRRLHAQFMTDKIAAMSLSKAKTLIDQHKQKGDVLLVITATNEFVTAPIVKALGIDNLLASGVEQVDGHYTGEPEGIPCFAEGKVQRLKQWLDEQDESVRALDTYFYSDSRNDLPLLEQVDYPVAVDPDPTLAEVAKTRGWTILSLR